MATVLLLWATLVFANCRDSIINEGFTTNFTPKEEKIFNPLHIAYGHCDDISKKSFSSEDFAKTTYWSKVISALAVRASTAPTRFAEHPVGLTSDIAMVFISPRIKQSLRNQMVKQGIPFTSKTILEYYPHRLGLNLSVSAIDAVLAGGAGYLETQGNIADSFSHGVKRFASNGVTYVFLDPLLTGVSDYIVMQKLLPFLIQNICKKYTGQYALWLARGAIAVSFLGVGAGIEAIQFLGVRSFLFNNQDVIRTKE
jgi:hypothetical protein